MDQPTATIIHRIFKYIFSSLLMLSMVSALSFFPAVSSAAADSSYISEKPGQNYLPLVSDGKAVSLCVSSSDYPGVLRVAGHLQNDIRQVTGIEPEIIRDKTEGNILIIIGTIGKSPVIDTLIKNKKIDAELVSNRWDTYAVQTVDNPVKGVERALVIFGSNKRGTIYGIYDLSSKIGVSPWCWWADVPVQKKPEIYVKPGFYSPGEPKVKYRGIFINDEAPALSGWAREKFGGFNHGFYEKVFELILRNRGNYLWPAMWLPSAFSDDDPENPRLADEYGIIMSTSHHEPMMRAHAEWERFKGGEWNYETNKEKLQEFWRSGFKRNAEYENVVTVGMRGDGDAGMSEETAVDLLKTIVNDQRKIIADVTGKPARETQQVWAVYKEVQDYYDKGMRVDDDITILFCDDNWGNLRILPEKQDIARKGGYGIYYHFDFVGGPVSYRWLNVTQIERVWEQTNLAYRWGVKDIWIVNVGDIKPMELPISFFLDLAWNPEAITAGDLPDYYGNWAREQFGGRYADEIAEVLQLYSKYNARRTPEMVKPDTYSIENYREADRIVSEYNQLYDKAKSIYDRLPEDYKSAFYQVVLFPVEACNNLNEMYVAAGKNKYYGELGFAAANYYAEKVKNLFDRDAGFTGYFHEKLEKGKWNHMMSQTHIGYTNWSNPPLNMMPAVSFVQPEKSAGLGILVEKARRPVWGSWPLINQMPVFDPVNDQDYYVMILNKGDEELSYDVKAKENWIKLSSGGGKIKFHEKVYISIDWQKVPKGCIKGEITVSGAGEEYVVQVPLRTDLPEASGFIENNGVVSIEAVDYSNIVNSKEVSWTAVPNLGRTKSAMIITPSNAEPRIPGNDSPMLEYTFTVFDEGSLKVDTYVSPTQNFQKTEGLKYAIAIDDEALQIVNINEGEDKPDWQYPDWWTKSVADHIKIKQSVHGKVKPGIHKLKVWMIDPGIVFQKFVIDAGGLMPSYLGPPESIYLN